MSTAPLRRADKLMSDIEAKDFLAQAFCLRIGTLGADGWPYVLPLLFVMLDGEVLIHTMAAHGHFRENFRAGAKVCIEVDEPGQVFAYGQTECDTSVSFQSVIAFGLIREIEARDQKLRFCSALMAKYAAHIERRAKGEFPRIDHIRVYSIAIERITGKRTVQPGALRTA